MTGSITQVQYPYTLSTFAYQRFGKHDETFVAKHSKVIQVMSGKTIVNPNSMESTFGLNADTMSKNSINVIILFPPAEKIVHIRVRNGFTYT